MNPVLERLGLNFISLSIKPKYQNNFVALFMWGTEENNVKTFRGNLVKGVLLTEMFFFCLMYIPFFGDLLETNPVYRLGRNPNNFSIEYLEQFSTIGLHESREEKLLKY
uniref:Uncharacterized protein n=1 Tax=Anguilla anguilla TaxID=7936 RepID=A0A0E9X925_ANGAN